ncbi:PEP-CTERM sorting domain-containing protein [Candidatus Poribacteria bacterium]|nr:PEP-CTERM sorting domain-containing protein [Candidatus Poribacteria bacterium]
MVTLVIFITDRASATPLTEGWIAFHSYTSYTSIDGVISVFNLKTNTHYEFAELTIANGVQHAMNPKFSSDGSQLVFMGLPKSSTPYDDSWPNYLDIFLYDFHTDKLTNLSEKAGMSYEGDVEEDPDFSPDGQKVIFKKNRSDLWTIDLGTYGLSQVTYDGVEKEESGPRYSPDGQWIAYWISSGSNADIYRIPAGGGSSEAIVSNENIQDMYPAYLASDYLLYSRWREGFVDDDIYVVNLSQNPYSHTSALFNSDSDDSDPFAIGGSLVGFSSNRSGGKGGWDLFYGNLYSNELYYLEIASTTKHDLGGTFTPYLSTTIPEPSTILMLSTGLVGIAGYAVIKSHRKRRNSLRNSESLFPL